MDNNIANVTDDLVQAIAGDNVSNLHLDAESNIMVIGVGGAGGNAVNHMQQLGITGVNFVACNTDEKALNNCSVRILRSSENKRMVSRGMRMIKVKIRY